MQFFSKAMTAVYLLLTLLLEVCIYTPVCVCVCVCERECERNGVREKAVWSVLHSVHISVSKATIMTHNLLLLYLKNKRWGRDNTAVKYMASLVKRCLLKDFISCKPVPVLRKQVFWVVALCGWLTAP